MFFLKFSSLLIITSFLLSDCPEGFYEDECGNCVGGSTSCTSISSLCNSICFNTFSIIFDTI